MPIKYVAGPVYLAGTQNPPAPTLGGAQIFGFIQGPTDTFTEPNYFAWPYVGGNPPPTGTAPPITYQQPTYYANTAFNWAQVSGASSVDAFLGLTPGTTQYGEGAGRLFAISGALIAPTSSGVSALLATLKASAGPPAGLALGLPTGNRWPDNWVAYPNCYFVLAELVPSGSGIVQSAGGQYSLSYNMIVRQVDAGAS